MFAKLLISAAFVVLCGVGVHYGLPVKWQLAPYLGLLGGCLIGTGAALIHFYKHGW